MLAYNGRNMKTQSEQSFWLPLLITGIAIVLFSIAGMARMLGWGMNSTGVSDDIEVSATSDDGAGPRCPECAMIVSKGDNEIIVRMADGSSRVIEDANPARWRTGERLMIIAGANPSPP